MFENANSYEDMTTRLNRDDHNIYYNNHRPYFDKTRSNYYSSKCGDSMNSYRRRYDSINRSQFYRDHDASTIIKTKNTLRPAAFQPRFEQPSARKLVTIIMLNYFY